MITLENLGHHQILQSCSLSIIPQQITALIGENGVGKTTLLQLIAGEKIPTSGIIHRPQKSAWLGYVPDKAPIYPHLTVENYLHLCAEMRGVLNIQEACEKALFDCQLENVRQQKCATLSQGYRQRVGLAQAIIHRPELLILDEISNGLDFHQKRAVSELLKRLKNELTILMISHDWQEVLTLADQIYLLHQGRLHLLTLQERSIEHLEAQIHALKNLSA